MTYRRTERVALLVPTLVDEAALLMGRHPGVTARVLVVDNDPTGSASRALESVDTAHVRVVVEARPGIPSARSRALLEAGTDDVLVFIDDDEVPTEGWLLSLHDCWAREKAAAVAGPVRTEFPPDVDPFVVEGGFYDRSHAAAWQTGDSLPRAATNNVWLDLRQVRESEASFDERFRTTGGEDTAFTATLVRRGFRIVWCREAAVVEHLLPERATRVAALGRAYALSNSGVSVSSAMARDRRERVLVALRAVGTVGANGLRGLGHLVAGGLRDRGAHHARGRRDLARARGALDALVGRRAEPYARKPSP